MVCWPPHGKRPAGIRCYVRDPMGKRSSAYHGTRNLQAVQTLLGHALITTTERYTAVDDDEARGNFERVVTTRGQSSAPESTL